MEELPPRTRRILFPHLKRGHVFGTNSAYAENTECSIDRAGEAGNYLRVRGEYTAHLRRSQRFWGTTSAYAENTAVSSADEW